MLSDVLLARIWHRYENPFKKYTFIQKTFDIRDIDFLLLHEN